MGPKTKGKGTKKAWREAVGPSVSAESTQPKVRQQQEVFLPETEVTDERSTEEDMASDEDAQSWSSSSTGQGTKLSNMFCPADEEILVDFFRDHPELYDHSSEMYHHRPHQVRLLEKVAQQLNTTGEYHIICLKSLTMYVCANILPPSHSSGRIVLLFHKPSV